MEKNTFHHMLETDSQALLSPERCTLFILSVVEKKFNMGKWLSENSWLTDDQQLFQGTLQISNFSTKQTQVS